MNEHELLDELLRNYKDYDKRKKGMATNKFAHGSQFVSLMVLRSVNQKSNKQISLSLSLSLSLSPSLYLSVSISPLATHCKALTNDINRCTSRRAARKQYGRWRSVLSHTHTHTHTHTLTQTHTHTHPIIKTLTNDINRRSCRRAARKRYRAMAQRLLPLHVCIVIQAVVECCWLCWCWCWCCSRSRWKRGRALWRRW